MADIPIFPNGADFELQRLINLADGTSATDGVTLQQVQSLIKSTLKGPYNASTNTPDLVTPSAGVVSANDKYHVNVAGTFFGEAVAVGDLMISLVDDPSSLADWLILEMNIVDSDDITEGSVNKFVTADQQDALNSANSPSTSNPLLTENDLPSLSEVLDVGNTSGAHDILMDTTRFIQFGSNSNQYIKDLNTNQTELGVQRELRVPINNETNANHVFDGSQIISNRDDKQFKIGFLNGFIEWANASISGYLDFSNLTSARDWDLPDKSGVLAVVSDILSTVLTGISFATSTAITAADTILTALGKLQAQVTINNAKVTNATHTGDVTGSTALTIANDAVTFAKMQNVSAASRLIGRGSGAGAGDPQEISLGTGLTMTGSVLSSSGAGANYTGALGATFMNSSLSTWQVRTVTGASANTVIDIHISNSLNNVFAGVRSVGSSVDRIVETRYGMIMTVKTNASSQIEVKTNDLGTTYRLIGQHI